MVAWGEHPYRVFDVVVKATDSIDLLLREHSMRCGVAEINDEMARGDTKKVNEALVEWPDRSFAVHEGSQNGLRDC